MGFRSHIHGSIKLDPSEFVDRKVLRFMGDGAAYAYIAMQQAIEDSGLEKDQVSNDKTGLIIGSGGPSTSNMMTAFDLARNKGPKRVGPYMVPRVMSSTVSATLATSFQIKGLSYSISSACSTSAHCIGNAFETIQLGKQDIIFAGGGENCTGHCLSYSMQWEHFHLNITSTQPLLPARMMWIVMDSLFRVAVVS